VLTFGGNTTFTVTFLYIFTPKLPSMVIVYVVPKVGVTLCEPLRSVLPIAGSKLTDVALVVLQFSKLDEPDCIVVGLADRVPVGPG
jgi:hypothetical protein